MRWTATLVSAVVIVFSVTFIVTRRTADVAPAPAQLVASPVAAGTPLRVRTLRGAPPLPRLRDRAPAAAAVVAPAPPAPPAPSASPAVPEAPPSASAGPPGLCARAAWMQLTGGAPALPRTGRC